MNTSGLRACALAAAAAGVAGLAGCASGPSYDWDYYAASIRRTAPDDLGYDPIDEITKLEGAAEWIQSRGRSLPPGYRSHLGWMHYNQGQFVEARALFVEEAALYPEAAVLMDLLIDSIDGRQTEVGA